jgi:ATP-binding cassette subfamily B protein
VSFRVGAGETVALVGPSRAGKSTLFDLALRFWDPTKGAVLLDGIDLRHCTLEAVRSRTGLVPQDPVLFAGTLLDNLRFGDPEASPDAIRAALESASALSFVEVFPEGLETRIGEDGVGLSGRPAAATRHRPRTDHARDSC